MTDAEYFESEEFRDILKEYEEKDRLGGPLFMDLDDMADVADYYHMNGQVDEAMAIIERAQELYPGATPPLVYKIHNALDNQDIDEAYRLLGMIDDKQDLEYLLIQGEILIAQDRIDEAEQLFSERFRTITPEQHQDFVVDVANIYSNYNVHDKAMQWSTRALPEDTDDFRELMARTLFGLGKYDESEQLFNELIDRHPYSVDYWNAIASTQYMKGDYNAAVTSSEYAIAIDPDNAEALQGKANGLQRLENHEEAVKYFERYLEKIPDDELALLNLGVCLINLGKLYEATTRLHQALDVAQEDSPYLAEIYQELGFAYSELHQPKTALHYLEKTDDMDCDHTEVMVVKGHVHLANGNIKKAEEIFRKIIEDPETPPRALLRILVSLYDNKYVHAAYKMFPHYFEVVGDDSKEGYSYMALCCWDLQRYEEFLKCLEKAVERNPQEARLVLSPLFPQGTDPTEYYNYMKEHLKPSI